MEFKNLTLSVFQSTLNGITLYEPVDVDVLDKLLYSDFLMINDEWNEKKQLEKYKQNIHNGVAKVVYKKTEGTPFGRVSADGALGLHMIRKEIRHTLAKDRFIDIDIENCHPYILYQLCVENMLNIEYLGHYIYDREHYLKQVMDHYKCDRESAKNLFIILLYCGSINTWKQKNNIDTKIPDLDFIKKFKEEFKEVAEIIYNKNPELYKSIENAKLVKGQKMKNKYGSVLSYFLQEVEFRILTELYKYCVSKGYIKNNVAVLCSDGIMLEKQHINQETILTEFKDLIRDKMELDVNFTIKEMDKYYENIEDNIKIDYMQEFNTDYISMLFKVLYNDKFIYNEGQLYYYNGVYWEKDDKNNNKLFTFIMDIFQPKILNKLIIYYDELNKQKLQLLKEDDEKVKDKEGKLKKNEKILKDFITKVKNIKNKNFSKSIIENIINRITNNNIQWDENPFMFCFKNKVYDLQEGEFIQKPDYRQFIRMNTDYYYNDSYDTEKKVAELDKLLDTIFPNPETKKYYLTILSTGLYGEQIEYCFIATGRGRNGKGLLNSLMMKCVGDYGYKLSSSVLLNEIKQGANPEIANMNNKRFIITTEPDAKKKVNASTLKEITGDKIINARALYSGDTKCILKNTLLMEANDLPPLNEVGDAVGNRVKVIPFVSSFFNKEVIETLKPEERKNVFECNPYYKTDKFQDEYKQALFEILVKHFKQFQQNDYKLPNQPMECKEKSDKYLQSSDTIYKFILENYEKENNSYVYIADIYDVYKSEYPKTSVKKGDFEEQIKNNIFLRSHYAGRDTRFNGLKHKKGYLMNYKLKDAEDDEPEKDEEKNPLDN